MTGETLQSYECMTYNEVEAKRISFYVQVITSGALFILT
ncbi:hypothetical protein PSDI105340_01445 [Pseudoalteromonas distincta]